MMKKNISVAIPNEDQDRSSRTVTSDPKLRYTTSSVADRKKSMISTGSSGRNSQSGPSLLGLTASKRYAKRLSRAVVLAREETQGSSLQLPPSLILQEPTYRMEPTVTFKSSVVKDIIKQTLDNRLDGMIYNGKNTPTLCKIMSEDIKDKVKKLNYDRFKIVCMIFLGENKNQGIVASSRCQWDPKTDTYASYTFQNKQIVCTGTVFGIYAE